MQLSQELEEKLKSKVLNILENARPNWEIPHMLATVHYIKELLKKEKGNPKILVSTMYLHDIGYAELFKNKKADYEGIKDSKKEHMIKGAILAEKILKELIVFSEEEINKIKHLISVHDDLEKINSSDEQLVFEADSLSQIDKKRVTSNFSEEDYQKFINDFKNKRAPRFKTKTGKMFLKQLI